MGGFPFRIHEERRDEVEASHFGDSVTFEEHVTALSAHAAKIIFNITLQIFLYGLLGYNEAGFILMFSRMKEKGLTTTHFVSTALIFISNSLGLFGFLYCVKGFAKPLNELGRAFRHISEELNIKPENIDGISTRCLHSIYFLYGLNCLSAIMGGMSTTFLLSEQNPLWMMVLNFILMTITSFDIYFPQTAVSGHLMAIQSLGVVGLQLNEYVERLKQACLEVGIDEGFVARKTRWAKVINAKGSLNASGILKVPCSKRKMNLSLMDLSNQVDKNGHDRFKASQDNIDGNIIELFDSLTNLGYLLIDTVKQAEEAFSNFFFMEFTACIVTSVFGFFFGLLIVGAFVGSSFQIIPFMFGVFPGFLGILSFVRLFQLIRPGHRIGNASKSAQTGLEYLLIGTYHKISEFEKCKFKVLIRKFNEQGCIRPHSSFQLNYTTGLSLSGLLLTYIIVLMQFNLNERQLCET